MTSLISRFIRTLLLAAIAAISAAGTHAAAPDQQSITLLARYGMLGVADDEAADPLAGLELRFPQNWQGVRPWIGLNLTDGNTWFAGAGLVYDIELTRDYRATVGTGPFYYQNRPGRDLGLELEFYSFLEITRELPRDQRLGIRIGHLSNAGLGRRNPGSETVSIVFTRPFSTPRRWTQIALPREH